MNTQKQRIADFIESVKAEEVGTSTVLLGGATKQPDGTMTTSNNGDCKNGNYDSCNKATNRGSCTNVKNFCNSSKNGGECINDAGPVDYANNCK